jgi:DNA-binding CsgD family transcriptional regulator
VAMDLGATEQARRHLTRSLRLSHVTGARIGVARGLEAFAALTGHEGRPELAVQLTAAATALRETAGLPPLPGSRVEGYLAPARRQLGDAAVARLWTSGRALTSEAAVALALDAPGRAAPPPDSSSLDSSTRAAPIRSAPGRAAAPGAAPYGDAGSPALTVVGGYQVASAPPSSLTQRELQIAELVASGRSNKAIADELSISHTTAARHVANIMAKLGFNSRTQIAAWIANRSQGPGQAGGPAEPG